MPFNYNCKKKIISNSINCRNISYIRTPGSPILFRGSPFTREILIYAMSDLIPGLLQLIIHK